VKTCSRLAPRLQRYQHRITMPLQRHKIANLSAAAYCAIKAKCSVFERWLIEIIFHPKIYIPVLSVLLQRLCLCLFQPLADTTCTQGKRVTLECRLPATVVPDRVQWYCKGLELASSPDYLISSCVDGLCTLTIVEVFPEDSGSYSCVATCRGAPVSTSMNLKVSGEKLSGILFIGGYLGTLLI